MTPRLTRKTVLAVEAVLDIAYYGRVEPVQAKEITARQGVPQRFLEQAMQLLVQHGVLKGVRGPRGGYVLAKERRRITVGEIVRLVSQIETGEESASASDSDLGRLVVGPLWDGAMERLLEELSSVTIQDLCARAAARGVARPGDEAAGGGDPDFTI